jgi:hypothetical protein
LLAPVTVAARARATEAERVTVDRVVASIGSEAITGSDVIREYRFEGFVADGRVPAIPPGPNDFRAAESRLIDQELLERQLKGDPADSSVTDQQASRSMAAIRKKFNSPETFEAALHSLGLSPAALMKRLEQQQAILEMVDERFRPAAGVGASDIQRYYREVFLPEFARRASGPAPPLSQVQDQIREILVQERINGLLREWLTELKRESGVRLISK